MNFFGNTNANQTNKMLQLQTQNLQQQLNNYNSNNNLAGNYNISLGNLGNINLANLSAWQLNLLQQQLTLNSANLNSSSATATANNNSGKGMEEQDMARVFEDDFGQKLTINSNLGGGNATANDTTSPHQNAGNNLNTNMQDQDNGANMANQNQNGNVEETPNSFRYDQQFTPLGGITPFSAGIANLLGNNFGNLGFPNFLNTPISLDNNLNLTFQNLGNFPDNFFKNNINNFQNLQQFQQENNENQMNANNFEHAQEQTTEEEFAAPMKSERKQRKGSSSGKKHRMSKDAKLKRAKSAFSNATEMSKDENRWKSWAREEEVFLVGAVVDRFFKRGSLSSTRNDDLLNDDCWSYIKNCYDRLWTNYQLCTGISNPLERSVNALSRHYKVMKARISQADLNGEEIEDFRVFYDEFQEKYNFGNRLLRPLPTSNFQIDSMNSFEAVPVGEKRKDSDDEKRDTNPNKRKVRIAPNVKQEFDQQELNGNISSTQQYY